MDPKHQPPAARPVHQGKAELLQQRLKEAEETLQAIREGAVDALMVATGEGDQVFTLKSADYPYRLIIDKMVQGAVIFDDTGLIFYTNATFAGMVNLSHQELFGLSIYSFIAEEDREFFSSLVSCHSGISGGTGSMHLVCKDRQDLGVVAGLISIKIDDQFLHCAIFTDLTEQKKYDRALANEKFSRMILEQTGELVVVCDPAGRIVRHSDAAETLLCEPLLHARFHDKFRFSFSPDVACSSPDEEGRTEWNVVGDVMGGHTLLRQEGDLLVGARRIPVLLSARPLHDENEDTIGAIITMIDITERKKAEQDLQNFNDSLEQRIVDRTRDLLKYQKHLRDMTSELVGTEQRERRRLATELHDYLAQLLVVGRMKIAQLTREEMHIALKRDIEEIDKILEDSIGYTRTLIAELSPNILYELGIVPALIWLGKQFERHALSVRIEEAEKNIPLPEDQAVVVYQAVRELLFNVKKHADTDHATVSIEMTATHELQVKVADAGKGFQVSDSSHDYAIPGKFGLFSIRERVESLGGSIHIDSKGGEGTCITLLVPCISSMPSESSRENRELLSSPHSPARLEPKAGRDTGIRIVLADDHTLVREGIRGILENQSDFHVVGEAQDGWEAIEHSRRLSPDVIVMDVNMPKLNGIEATRRILMDCPSMPIIGLSVQEDDQVRTLMLKAGAAIYLTKNGIATDLVDGIRKLVAKSPKKRKVR